VSYTELLDAKKNNKLEEVINQYEKEELNAIDENGKSLLMMASAHGEINMVKQLISSNAQVNLKGQATFEKETGYKYLMETAIEVASAAGNNELVRLFINAGADQNSIGNALRGAASMGHTEVVHSLLNAIDKNSEDYKSYISNALLDAATNNRLDIANLFLDNTTLSAKGYALIAAVKNKHAEMTKRLLKYELSTFDIEQAFRFAANNNDVEVIKLLLNTGEVNLSTVRELNKKKNTYPEVSKIVTQYSLRKRGTHFLGIKDQFTGMDLESLKMFTDKLDKYHVSNQNFTEVYKTIQEAFHETSKHVKDHTMDVNNLTKSLKKRYDNSQLIIIPSGWLKHSITIAALKHGNDHYLIVANRGSGMVGRKGVIIYKLKQPLTEEIIKRLLNNKQTMDKTDITQLIKNITDSEFGFFTHKGQKYGTCAIANKKTAFSALIYFLSFINTIPVKENKINHEYSDILSMLESLDDDIATKWKKWLQKNNSECLSEYKIFSNFLRHETLDELLNEVNIDPEHASFILEGLANFCHTHTPYYKVTEEELLTRIVKELPQRHWQEFSSLLNEESRKIINNIKESQLSKKERSTTPYKDKW